MSLETGHVHLGMCTVIIKLVVKTEKISLQWVLQMYDSGKAVINIGLAYSKPQDGPVYNSNLGEAPTSKTHYCMM